VTAPPPQTVVEGSPLTVSAAFADAGVLDTHTAVIDWGEGAAEPMAVAEQGGAGSASAGHTYADDGTHAASVTVTDDAGDATTVAFFEAAIQQLYKLG